MSSSPSSLGVVVMGVTTSRAPNTKPTDVMGRVPSSTVRFQEGGPLIVERIPNLADISRTEKEAVWWTAADIDGFRTKAKEAIRQCPPIFILCLQQASILTPQQRRRNSITSVVSLQHHDQPHLKDHSEEDEDEDDQGLDRNLNLWCRYNTPCRGLERMTSSLLRHRAKTRRAVLLSKIVHHHHHGSNNKGAVSFITRTEEDLRRISEKVSMPAKTFARQMAKSDALAAWQQTSDVSSSSPPPARFARRALEISPCPSEMSSSSSSSSSSSEMTSSSESSTSSTSSSTTFSSSYSSVAHSVQRELSGLFAAALVTCSKSDYPEERLVRKDSVVRFLAFQESMHFMMVDHTATDDVDERTTTHRTNTSHHHDHDHHHHRVPHRKSLPPVGHCYSSQHHCRNSHDEISSHSSNSSLNNSGRDFLPEE